MPVKLSKFSPSATTRPPSGCPPGLSQSLAQWGSWFTACEAQNTQPGPLQVARLDFPNLSLESTKVEFGSCLSDTTARVPVRITNCSAVDAVYSWAWEADSLKEDANSIASRSVRSVKGGNGHAAAAVAKPPAEQLFDILPIKGMLRPGESETVNFSFFAFPGVKASAMALCLVEGGPNYTVSRQNETTESGLFPVPGSVGLLGQILVERIPNYRIRGQDG